MNVSKNSPEVEEQQIIDEASEWLLRLDEDATNHWDAWQLWMEKDDRHPVVFHKMMKMWGMASDLDEALIQRLESKNERNNVVNLTDVETPPRFSGRWFALAASVLLAVAIPLVWLQQKPEPKLVKNDPVIQSYHTQVAEHSRIQLDDGSVVQLGANSVMEVMFSALERHIFLHSGEALFTVAKDPKRPFIVESEQRAVRAIGTIFNINLNQNEMEVVVVEGIVRVESEKVKEELSGLPQVKRLYQGDSIVIDVTGKLGDVAKVDPIEKIRWQDGYFSYLDQPLGKVVGDLNRYSEEKIILDSGASAFLYTGSVYNDRIQDWLNALTEIYPIRVTHIGNKFIVKIQENKG
ncbi:FecR family protein [Teredinibacter sp. KSP-S5-2]|uniref:FecR family protein n=1 Tax=Teredinibacter sp. KSP-S5-2 TaxID=3034506 RepID=UPI002934DD94|nr:FecR domain-containing protein [Teredinibacter sp. KSP-S5-2]WNO08674.1 FecR domain-containing protein [Teredinibacter sp. KSP-S5-2]